MPTLQQRFAGLTDPAVLLAHAVYYFILVLVSTLLNTRSLGLDIETIREKSFSRFWLEYMSAPGPQPPPPPSGSVALVPGIFAAAAGDVLHIGPGSGTQVKLFASNPQIRHFYGAEPAAGLHDQLAAEIREAGLTGKYEILHCKADTAEITAALEAKGKKVRKDGQFDSIVCVRVLCSVPNPEVTVREMYHLLKPGGRLLVLEHVVNPWQTSGSIVARLLQAFYMLLGWKFFVGGCCMDRDMHGIIQKIGSSEGGWQDVNVKRHFGWSCLPYISGEYRRRE